MGGRSFHGRPVNERGTVRIGEGNLRADVRKLVLARRPASDSPESAIESVHCSTIGM